MEPVFDLEIEDNHNFVANGLLVHNCHHMSARTFWDVITSFPADHFLGFTATPRRTDDLEDIFFWTIGDVLAVGDGDKLDCRVNQVIYEPYISWDDITVKGRAEFWKLLELLARDTERTEMLGRIIAKAARKGRKIIVLANRLELIARLQEELEWIFAARGEPYTVGHFKSGKTKKIRAEKKRAKEATVCIGTDRIIKEGFDLPDLDTLVLASPMKDVEQAAGRIRRILEGKKDPVVVAIHDDHPFLHNSHNAQIGFFREAKWKITTFDWLRGRIVRRRRRRKYR